MTTTIPGDPIWVIAALTQSQDEDDGVVTVASKILAVTRTREVAEDVLNVYGRSVGSDMIDIWIEESTLVDW